MFYFYSRILEYYYLMCGYNACNILFLELPTMLKISVEGNNVTIYPSPLHNYEIVYQSSSSNIEDGAIFLEKAGPTFILTFLCMERNASFIIGGWIQLKLNLIWTVIES